MAMNPPMFDAVTPMSRVGEFFLLERSGLAFQIDATGLPKLKSSKARLYLTTMRIVLVPDDAKQLKDGFIMRAFELPLDSVEQEKFNQPIFGANNLAGVVRPVAGMGLDANSSFKVWFNHGGAGTLLPLFFRALLESRRPVAAASSLAHAITSGNFAATAVADPNDPSVLYLTQPDIPTATEVAGRQDDEENTAPSAPPAEK